MVFVKDYRKGIALTGAVSFFMQKNSQRCFLFFMLGEHRQIPSSGGGDSVIAYGY
jgi:hypothetical protein